jgi:hypothetical protein
VKLLYKKSQNLRSITKRPGHSVVRHNPLIMKI